jgi:hypothetical protein
MLQFGFKPRSLEGHKVSQRFSFVSLSVFGSLWFKYNFEKYCLNK